MSTVYANNELFNRIMNGLPEYLSDSNVFSSVVSAYSGELEQQLSVVRDIEQQLSPLTATWSLPMWEQQYNIEDNGDDMDLRRARVLSKMIFTAPLTPEMLKKILSNFASDITIEQVPEQYRFVVTFNVQDRYSAIVRNIHKVINDVKPAHLSYDIGFGFTQKTDISTSIQYYKHLCNTCGTLKCGGNGLINGGRM